MNDRWPVKAWLWRREVIGRLAHVILVGAGLFLEELVESLSHVIAIDFLCSPARREWDPVVWLEIVAKISFELVLHVFRRRLTALIVLPGIKETTILAAMNIGRAVRTLIGARELSNDSDLPAAIMTNHRTGIPLVWSSSPETEQVPTRNWSSMRSGHC